MTIHPILSRLALTAAADAIAARAALYAGPLTHAARHALGVARATHDALDDVAARCADPAAALASLDADAATYARPEPGSALDMVESWARLAEGHREAARRVRAVMAEPSPEASPTVAEALDALIAIACPRGPEPGVMRARAAVLAAAEAQGEGGVRTMPVGSDGVSWALVALRAELAAARRLAEQHEAASIHPDADTELGEASGRVLGLERALSILGGK